jgi:hypothetical protein
MPTEKTRAHLRWKGMETVQEILERLHERERLLIALPPGLHNALCVRLSARGDMHAPVDVAVDDTAFESLTSISGLQDLAKLREPLARANMTLRVRTPPPRIVLAPRTSRVERDAHCCDTPALVMA